MGRVLYPPARTSNFEKLHTLLTGIDVLDLKSCNRLSKLKLKLNLLPANICGVTTGQHHEEPDLIVTKALSAMIMRLSVGYMQTAEVLCGDNSLCAMVIGWR